MQFNNLLKWSKKEFSHLPWRKKRSLYRTLVSEIMLQQTTVSTVVNHFDRFIKTYPNFKSLAATTEEEICIAWKGLGYYRRARNLRLAAIEIAARNSRVPESIEELKKIHGIGDYTANAIKSIGRDKPALALDANLERVISRLFMIKMEKGLKLQKEIQKLFSDGEIFSDIEKVGPRALNEALMDVGRVYCQAKKVDCTLCPLSKICLAYKHKQALDFPIVKEVKKESFDLELIRFVVRKGGKVLVYQKSKTQWLSGQYELPTYIQSSEDLTLKQYPKLLKKQNLKNLKKFKSAITKYKITNYIKELSPIDFEKKIEKNKKYKFIEMNLETMNFSTASIKTLLKIT